MTSYECKCAACGGTIRFTGETAEIVASERSGPIWCDEICQRGSGVRLPWMRQVPYKELLDMERTLKKRRQMVMEYRR